MWYERDLDALMAQTRRRPIPARRIAPAKALAFGIALSLASVIAMAMVANRTAALLLALAISFYLFVYTIWLKRRTPQNIVIGGAADALPRSEEHTSELQSLMRISYAVFCLK